MNSELILLFITRPVKNLCHLSPKVFVSSTTKVGRNLDETAFTSYKAIKTKI